MKTIGLVVSRKENEKRRALVPGHIVRIKHPEFITIEKGYGEVLGFKDEDYTSKGCKVATREEVLKCDVVCDPKIGDAEYLGLLENQTIFGWVHAVQNRDITDKIIKHQLTSYA